MSIRAILIIFFQQMLGTGSSRKSEEKACSAAVLEMELWLDAIRGLHKIQNRALCTSHNDWCILIHNYESFLASGIYRVPFTKLLTNPGKVYHSKIAPLTEDWKSSEPLQSPTASQNLKKYQLSHHKDFKIKFYRMHSVFYVILSSLWISPMVVHRFGSFRTFYWDRIISY